MFGSNRRNRAERPATAFSLPDSVGVGALVVVSGSPESGWVGEPTGVVIAPGDNEMAGYPGLAPGGPVSWLIAFDEPAFRTGIDAPFDEGTVASRYVAPLPGAVTDAPADAAD
ncbi:hypothetical protein [Subtercola lobariae]|uniref:Uncharacterized protein n=1 Tax=Subtercola lobariae TaxID=1588641 RepID=A0A917ETR6_9MICO|nr:hypothetical protein [Subtercola lobariae]GGF12294.1 hypothetical protein GCM10011399_02800 [Subtercola lobariae]